MSIRDKWVRRFSIDETTKHKNGFTIYKITSVLFPLESPEAVTVVSVWKRYSDVQRLHKAMRALHAGLHLRGNIPKLAKTNYFKRFQQDVIDERMKTLKALLDFVAEHRLLFTSTEFVNFLQTGYPEPERPATGVINAIRSSLHLPIEDTPPLEYHTDDEDRSSSIAQSTEQPMQQTELDVSHIPIYEAADVELRESPKIDQKISNADSFESINSLDSIDSDLYDELNKVTIDKSKPCVKKVLPDLIIFDAPSTSTFEEYNTLRTESETVSLTSTVYGSSTSVYEESRGSLSRSSLYSKQSALSRSTVECRTRTEDSYVFEAGHILNLAARCEDMGDYERAFECYKSGIEKMLIGVQSDTDQQRRAIIKEKTNKYLSYAEAIYKNHLCHTERSVLEERPESRGRALCGVPSGMLRQEASGLAHYRVLALLGTSLMLVVHHATHTCYAMKVIQKIPNNLTEFDDYFLQRVNETRQPILPTLIPYMVPLHAYIETNNLIFLILAYAPGEKLFDYIKNHSKSIPNTPARQVNLENVFTEPQKKIDLENDNIDVVEASSKYLDSNDNIDKSESLDNVDVSVNELVINSQRLLLNVDKALKETINTGIGVEAGIDSTRDTSISIKESSTKSDEVSKRREDPSPGLGPRRGPPRGPLPGGAVRVWGAEILAALESLHNCHVICRDLNPSNILLGDGGHLVLTYFIHYPDIELLPARKLRNNMYVAPELHNRTYLDPDRDLSLDRVCDFWSFGAIMYELICGVPLHEVHGQVFTSHTLLLVAEPDRVCLEARSLLTQLLTYDPAERLGSGPEGIEEIKRHPYFRHVDWDEVYQAWSFSQ